MVTKKVPAGKKLKLKKETIKDLNPKGAVKGGALSGYCLRRGPGAGAGIATGGIQGPPPTLFSVVNCGPGPQQG